ncbi:hypothetical protein [Klebsiella variicola]|uniref:hypothetical protein n=1 Tax=Klebsiella variicola TaxID=244366 RepID=UPI0021CB27C4|nr:hypothetical protein [Klebsiella variicola]MCS5939737.1 hypothetical protein [Klebsiella variicola subsp. variicola]
MTFSDEQKNASDKHADDPVQSGQSEQNTIKILKPGSNSDLIDQLRGGSLGKTSVDYEYHSPDPTEVTQRLALINYSNLSAGEEKMVTFKPVNLLQIMSSHKMETDDVALIAGTDSFAVESWFKEGVASETALHNIACAVGVSTEWIRGFVSGEDETLKANSEGLTKELQNLPPEEISVLAKSFNLRLKQISELDNTQQCPAGSIVSLNGVYNNDTEELLATYRLLPETERQNLYRVVCLRHKELARLYEQYI